MYKKDETRIASSSKVQNLFGDITKYSSILNHEKKYLMDTYPDRILDHMFNGIDTRIINICPMVLCDKLLADLSINCPDDLLAGIGITMYSISTHDDLVDELPRGRDEIAGLVYAGNIATLYGIQKLIKANYCDVLDEIIKYVNLNHYYQTKIVDTLWTKPCVEEVYLKSISHTKYWATIGVKSAIKYANRDDLNSFVEEFGECYGFLCQLFDDMREIKDDSVNKYWSLPMFNINLNNLDVNNPQHLNESIKRSREIAFSYYRRAKELINGQYPNLEDLIDRIWSTGSLISY